MTDTLNPVTPNCPVCGGFMPYEAPYCTECALYKHQADEVRKNVARAKTFGNIWRFKP